MIEREVYDDVYFFPYEDVLGYRIMLNRRFHFVINSNLSYERQFEILEQLYNLSNQYFMYEFILLQKDGQLYLDRKYKLSKRKKYRNIESNKVIYLSNYI